MAYGENSTEDVTDLKVIISNKCLRIILRMAYPTRISHAKKLIKACEFAPRLVILLMYFLMFS
jgi:hypothetical protein